MSDARTDARTDNTDFIGSSRFSTGNQKYMKKPPVTLKRKMVLQMMCGGRERRGWKTSFLISNFCTTLNILDEVWKCHKKYVQVVVSKYHRNTYCFAYYCHICYRLNGHIFTFTTVLPRSHGLVKTTKKLNHLLSLTPFTKSFIDNNLGIIEKVYYVFQMVECFTITV